jgi:hypothetical protein
MEERKKKQKLKIFKTLMLLRERMKKKCYMKKIINSLELKR